MALPGAIRRSKPRDTAGVAHSPAERPLALGPRLRGTDAEGFARGRARGRVTTVAVEAMAFHRPVSVGDVVSIHCEMLGEGRTSLTLGVEVWALRQPSGARFKVTEARFVFVAVDEQGRKRPLPVQ